MPKGVHNNHARGAANGRYRHGEADKTPEHRTWRAMMTRCYNQKRRCWKHYGGRGIRVCERWHIYENFLADMGRRPTPQHSLDRIDNNGGYTSENCRWATRTQQARNSRQAKLSPELVEQIRMASGTQEDIGRQFGVHQTTISRVRRGERWT